MTLEFALKYVVDNKQGLCTSLVDNIGEKYYNNLLLTNLISVNSTKWKVTKQAADIYKSFYKKPNFIEALKGYYCHYVLGF